MAKDFSKEQEIEQSFDWAIIKKALHLFETQALSIHPMYFSHCRYDRNRLIYSLLYQSSH